MNEKKSSSKIANLIANQKLKDQSKAAPVNLEAMINSGRVRIVDSSLKKIEDKSKKRK